MAAHFSVKPDSLADEKIDLSLHDLPPSTKVTLRSEVTQREKFQFSAFGFHHSDEKGSLLLSSDPSIGGTYSGTDPMGLIWSLKPEKGMRKGLRFLPDVLVPTEFKLLAYKGHSEDTSNAEKLAETTIRRHWISDGVSYEHVRHGQLRGMLFAPKDKSRKYPGVLDIFGGGGDLIAHRAALLASKGFVTLALPYFRYLDLPEKIDKLEMEYFVGAVEYLRQHDGVDDDNIGAVGLCKGADLVVETAVLSRHIKAIALVNGGSHSYLSDLYWKGKLYRQKLHMDRSKAYTDHDGFCNIKDCFLPFDRDFPLLKSIPIEQFPGKVALFVSGDDQDMPALICAEILMEKMKNYDRETDCEYHFFEDAGHILDPSYLPFCPGQYMPYLTGNVVAYGGSPAEHNAAQLRFWPLLIEFLNKNLKKDHYNARL